MTEAVPLDEETVGAVVVVVAAVEESVELDALDVLDVLDAPELDADAALVVAAVVLALAVVVVVWVASPAKRPVPASAPTIDQRVRCLIRLRPAIRSCLVRGRPFPVALFMNRSSYPGM